MFLFSAKMQAASHTIDDIKKDVFGDAKPITNLPEIISEIASRFLISKPTIEKELEKLDKKEWLRNLKRKHAVIAINDTLIEELSTEKNHNNFLIFYASQRMEEASPSLEAVMQELELRFSSQQVIKCFHKAGFFNQRDDMPHLKKAFSEYWNKDYDCASYFFCSLIETAVRALAKKYIGSQIKRKSNQHAGDKYRSLGALLQESTFSKINPAVCFYLRVVLVEAFGSNLRNRIAHGINKKDLWRRATSDRLLHAMLVLLWASDKKNRYELPYPL